MQFINSPQYTGIPMDIYNTSNTAYMNPPLQPGVPAPPQRPKIDPRAFETPNIVSKNEDSKSGGLFTISDDPGTNGNNIKVDNTPDVVDEPKTKKKRKSTSNTPVVTGNEKPSEKVSGIVEDTPTAYTYNETTYLLKDTLNQIDSLNAELATEFKAIKSNRTMKNKYRTMTDLSEIMSSLIGNRIQTIKEINNSITKSNDLDYKKLKDLKASQVEQDDDKYIADVYKAIISNQNNMPAQHQMPALDPSLYGSTGIVRADIMDTALNGGQPLDTGYLNYLSNITPEQNLMRYENDPNVKQVVVFDASTGAKFFKMMNLATGQVIENVPTYNEIIMEDTTLDVPNKIAKNINLNETFPIVVINDNVTSQY